MRAAVSDRAKALLSLGVVLGLGAVGTMAAWTDDATSTSTFSTGTVDLQLNDEIDDDYAFTTLGLTGMVPGNSMAAALPVQNKGSLPFTYTLAGAATNTDTQNLAGQLQLEVKTGATVAGAGSAKTCSGGTSVVSRTGLVGTAVTIPDTLAAGATRDLCFQVSLSASAPTGLQGATTTATFTFQATNS